MHGLETDMEHLIQNCERLGLLDGGHYVDYVLGTRGVFTIVRSDDLQVHSDFRYLKMGDGPYYVIHRPHVLIYYEAPRSIARAVREREATVTPMGAPVAETVAFGKRDLPAGQRWTVLGERHVRADRPR